MDIHEYQAKEILAKYGVKIAEGGLAYSPEESVQRAREIDGNIWVVKAQIHSGARGKAGGIKICRSHGEVEERCGRACWEKTCYPSDRAGGQGLFKGICRSRDADIVKELYLCFLIDRSFERIVMIGSAKGGMEIEELARDES